VGLVGLEPTTVCLRGTCSNPSELQTHDPDQHSLYPGVLLINRRLISSSP
jgi:hypothetical protein